MSKNTIKIKGAKANNLKNIDLEIPRDKMVVFTGLSGSGKSSLAFDTIYAEGQRRYVESLSSYARQFLGQMDKPDVEYIDGLSPSISIDQKTTNRNPRSTVGTVTEIYDYLRLLFAKIGIPKCPKCGTEIKSQSIDQMVDRVMALEERSKIFVLSPVIRGKKGEHKKLLENIKIQGFVRVIIDEKEYELNEEIELDKNKKHNIDIVVDRLIVKNGIESRLAESLETAFKFSDSIVKVKVVNGEEILFSEKMACPNGHISFDEIEPRTFSFNSPFGMCEDCNGLGSHKIVDPDLVVPDMSKSLLDGAIECYNMTTGEDGYYYKIFNEIIKYNGFDENTPFKNLSKETLDELFYGTNDRCVKFRFESKFSNENKVFNKPFEGIIKNLERRYNTNPISSFREKIETEIANKQGNLVDAQRNLLAAENALANKINSVESYIKVKDAVDAVIAKAKAGVEKLKADVETRLKKEAYEKKANQVANYNTAEKIKAAKEKAEAAMKAAAKKIEDKLNTNSDKTNKKLTIADVEEYAKEDHGTLAKEKVVVIEEVLDKADIEAYVSNKALLEAIPDQPVTDASAEETAYETAYGVLKTKKAALDEATKDATKKVSLLGIAIDADFSKDFFEKYGVQEEAVNILKTQLVAHKNELNKAKDDVVARENEKNEAEKALKAEPEDEMLKTKFENAKKALETAQEYVKEVQAKIDEVKGHLANLEAKSKELFETFRKYNEAVQKGATKAEMDSLLKQLDKIVKRYDDYAKKHNLPTIDISTSEVAEKSWTQVGGVWYYRDKDGKDVYKNAWGKINGLWYRFDEKGAMLADQWVKVGEEWYWVNANGRLSQNEWVSVNDQWYFANASGRIAQNEWFFVNDQWYFANPSGRMAQNEWFEVAGVWYYAKEDGRMACNETLEINGTKYSFDESGALA